MFVSYPDVCWRLWAAAPARNAAGKVAQGRDDAQGWRLLPAAAAELSSCVVLFGGTGTVSAGAVGFGSFMNEAGAQ